MKGVMYKDSFLMHGSKCYELYEAKKLKELDQLMKEIDKKEKDLLTRYSLKETN